MADDRLIEAVNIAAKVVSERLDAALRPLGLTASNYYFVLKMHAAGELTQDQLFKLIHLSPSNVTRRLAQLEAAGFVAKSRDPADGRTWRLALTAAGEALVPRLDAVLAGVNQAAFGQLNEAERRQLGRLLEQVTHEEVVTS